MTELDANILTAFFVIRDPALVQFFTLVTQLGSVFVVGGIALVTSLHLLARRRVANFAGLCVAIGATIVLVRLLKEVVARARPEAIYQAFSEDSFAFPSGHAALSIALYGFLAYLAWRYMPSRTWRSIAILTAIALIALVGFSRMYLGLHYVSDVAGGYVIGGAFLAFGIWISEGLKRRPVWS